MKEMLDIEMILYVYTNLKLTLISHFWPENFGLEIIAHHTFTANLGALAMPYSITSG